MHRLYYLVGGIGSGKTAAGELLASLGATVLSGDDAGRAVLAPGTPETGAVLRRWPQVADAGGHVDRAALGAMVFADPVALAELEEITAPGIAARLLDQVAEHPEETILIELPVLRDMLQAGLPRIVVDAPDPIRLQRALARDPRRGEAGIRDIMSRQPTRGEWLAEADWVIDNSGDRTALRVECERVWAAITATRSGVTAPR